MASAMARAAWRPPSQHTMTRSSLSGAFWIYGTTIIGRPDWNSVLSAISSSTALASGSAWPTMARSKRRAMRANWSPAPAALAPSVTGSAETPVARGRRGEPVDGGFRRGLVVGELGLDDFGRDVAGARNRHDRIEHECDPGDVGVESVGDGNGIVADHTAVLADAEIDDDILDHGGVSSVRQGGER